MSMSIAQWVPFRKAQEIEACIKKELLQWLETFECVVIIVIIIRFFTC